MSSAILVSKNPLYNLELDKASILFLRLNILGIYTTTTMPLWLVIYIKNEFLILDRIKNDQGYDSEQVF